MTGKYEMTVEQEKLIDQMREENSAICKRDREFDKIVRHNKLADIALWVLFLMV